MKRFSITVAAVLTCACMAEGASIALHDLKVSAQEAPHAFFQVLPKRGVVSSALIPPVASAPASGDEVMNFRLLALPRSALAALLIGEPRRFGTELASGSDLSAARASVLRIAGEVPAPVVRAELHLDLDALRRAKPTEMDTGPQARMLRVLRLTNARTLHLAAAEFAPAGPADSIKPVATRPSVMQLVLAWSSRSQPTGTFGGTTIGQPSFNAAEWPAGLPLGEWVFVFRPQGGQGMLGEGLAMQLRTGAAFFAAGTSSDLAERNPPDPLRWLSASTDADVLALSRSLGRTIFATSSDSERAAVTIVLPLRPDAKPETVRESLVRLCAAANSAIGPAGVVTLSVGPIAPGALTVELLFRLSAKPAAAPGPNPDR